MKSKKNLIFDKKNYIFLLVGLCSLTLFYILLGLNSKSVSLTKIMNLYLAPIGILASYALLAFAIFTNRRTPKSLEQ